MNNGGTAKIVTIVLAAVFGVSTLLMGGLVVGLSGRVRQNERDIIQVEVILEKISNIEKDISEIKEDMKNDR